ncbi:MAG: hypothetical protein ACQESP_07070 [Candidatus Muiribacteriota bacterium]
MKNYKFGILTLVIALILFFTAISMFWFENNISMAILNEIDYYNENSDLNIITGVDFDLFSRELQFKNFKIKNLQGKEVIQTADIIINFCYTDLYKLRDREFIEFYDILNLSKLNIDIRFLNIYLEDYITLHADKVELKYSGDVDSENIFLFASLILNLKAAEADFSRVIPPMATMFIPPDFIDFSNIGFAQFSFNLICDENKFFFKDVETYSSVMDIEGELLFEVPDNTPLNELYKNFSFSECNLTLSNLSNRKNVLINLFDAINLKYEEVNNNINIIR